MSEPASQRARKRESEGDEGTEGGRERERESRREQERAGESRREQKNFPPSMSFHNKKLRLKSCSTVQMRI